MRRTLIPLAAMLTAVMLAAATPSGLAGEAPPRAIDLQAHRGGMALAVESSPLSFGTALDLGVTTLELDVQITADGRAMITHDRRTTDEVCRDTAPATPDDPQFPYVGRLVKDLTFAQIRTLDCGATRRPAYPAQRLSPGSPMMELRELFDLVAERGADTVRFNVETKVEAAAPEQTAPREQFVAVVADEVRRAGVAARVSIQSFDLAALGLMRETAPELPRIFLMNESFLQLGEPGGSPWLGGLDADDLVDLVDEADAPDGADRAPDEARALIAAARTVDAAAISPVHGTPQAAAVTAPGYTPFTTPEMVRLAHDAGMEVIPWTVNDVPTMETLLDMGVDGIITDSPDQLRRLLEQRGAPLPRAVPAR